MRTIKLTALKWTGIGNKLKIIVINIAEENLGNNMKPAFLSFCWVSDHNETHFTGPCLNTIGCIFVLNATWAHTRLWLWRWRSRRVDRRTTINQWPCARAGFYGFCIAAALKNIHPSLCLQQCSGMFSVFLQQTHLHESLSDTHFTNTTLLHQGLIITLWLFEYLFSLCVFGVCQ